MANRFCIRRPLRRLLPSKLKVFYCLVGMATAAVVMRQIAVVIF
jgi:hypothetical protein